MKAIEFFAVVQKMRESQKLFFAMSSANPERQKVLNESRRLEGIIDREIQRVVSLTKASDIAAAWAPYDPCYATQQKFPI